MCVCVCVCMRVHTETVSGVCYLTERGMDMQSSLRTENLEQSE